MDDNEPYLTLLPGRNGWIIMEMVYDKALDTYKVTRCPDRKVYRDKAEAAAKAHTIGLESKLEVRL